MAILLCHTLKTRKTNVKSESMTESLLTLFVHGLYPLLMALLP
ncbi:hypothetical protein CHCC5022_0494 [Bacillus paralicheniformis]|nr:hypothetical protein CHCC5022_0494 [Bacillus paralicheniformis]TWJ81355.1 hypothetical protein CHCC5019_2786 [Bacillus paralicheniformis]